MSDPRDAVIEDLVKRVEALEDAIRAIIATGAESEPPSHPAERQHLDFVERVRGRKRR